MSLRKGVTKMRRKFTKVPILGMAITRADAISRLRSFSETVELHLLNCILYGDSSGDYNHWVNQELSSWMVAANRILLKGNKKLKKADYEDYLFGKLGDAEDDAFVALTAFQLHYTGAHSKVNPPYPNFELDEQITSDVFEFFREVKSKMCEILSQPNDLNKADFQRLLHEMMDKHCIKG